MLRQRPPQRPHQPLQNPCAQVDGNYNPVADPKAVVVLNHARFTVLTRRSSSAWNGRLTANLNDHASLVFLNRHLPVPEYTQELSNSGKTLTIKTGPLTLTYTPTGDGHFTASDLGVTLVVDLKQVTWHPGQADPANLQGTTRTLDGARGDQTREPIEPGLLSRSGWSVVDDSTRPLFDSSDFRFLQGEKSPWPWAIERPAGDRQDLYFFGYSHQYRKALGDYVTVAGRIPLPPRFAFGAWWSRYWDYTDQELNELVQGFRENDVPLDVLVIDMGWHMSADQLKAAGEKDQSGHPIGWSGYTWNKELFPDPDDFLKNLHCGGIEGHAQSSSGFRHRAFGESRSRHGQCHGHRSRLRNKYVPLRHRRIRNSPRQLYGTSVHHPLEKQAIDLRGGTDWQQEQKTAMPGVAPTWWLNYVHFTDQQREGKRPLLFHRWGGLGNHRYQIGFSGDTVSVWDSAGLPAVVYGHRSQRGLRLLEPRHWRPHARRGRS